MRNGRALLFGKEAMEPAGGKFMSIGDPGWTDDKIKDSLKEFKSIYERRPIKDNDGGMKAPHAFAAWFMLRELQPTTIVESGVWRGQGTWLLEQAVPNASLICLDIDFSKLYYRSPRATYVQQDFALIDFEGIDKSSTVLFFDDHQDQLLRLWQMKWKGIDTAIFEDNYPVKQGDCYSLRKILSGQGFSPQGPRGHRSPKTVVRAIHRKLLLHDSVRIPPNETHRKELLRGLRLYYEFPPLFREPKTRWGDEWNEEDYPTKPAILEAGSDEALQAEALHYNWICLIKLKSVEQE